MRNEYHPQVSTVESLNYEMNIILKSLHMNL